MQRLTSWPPTLNFTKTAFRSLRRSLKSPLNDKHAMRRQWLHMDVACSKTCYKTTKVLYFYCTLCGPASGFHKAVSVYHTWLSNNPVVGQTQAYPQDITPELLYRSNLYTSLSSLSLDFTYFVFLPYYYTVWSEQHDPLSSLLLLEAVFIYRVHPFSSNSSLDAKI